MCCGALQNQRSQHKNKSAAMQLLASRLEDAERCAAPLLQRAARQHTGSACHFKATSQCALQL
ncbi:MAG: hypothetical protein HC767_15070 [Akkermansiaceae bacterium]|nr:hypothetical protein [Akkermansiaceae bacterium]